MCFSASASFAAAAALAVVGTVTLAKSGGGRSSPYAAIPLLFGVQQLVEGVIWLGFNGTLGQLNPPTTFVYSLFSHVLWPIYVPFAVLLIEPRAWRRRLLAALFAAGSVIGGYLLVNMVRFPIEARLSGGHIEYASPHFYIIPVMAGYLAATCISGLCSSHRAVRLFGLAALASFMFAYAVYTRWFISVWCFFAAVLSAIVLLHFLNRPTFAKRANHATAGG